MTRPGEFVGAYQLVRHLGEGPFGMVWLARASASGQTCVLKLLRPGFVERPEGRAAFSRLLASVQIHGRLHHSNLVEIIEAVQDPGRGLYGISMAYVEGQTLADTQIPPAVIQGQDLRGLATILSWFEELGAALSWLHTQRIVHGNLKPSNVMLTQQHGRSIVKVLDLCWAAIGIAAPPPNALWSVAPEQLRGQPPTKESDQWALASMLARMLSGGQPQLRLGVMPQVLVMALGRALDEAPGQRYGHMAELVSAIRAIRIEIEQRARDSSPGRRAPGRVDSVEFEEEPATVRKSVKPTSNGSASRHDTPPMGLSNRVQELPMVPDSRALSKEISDENNASVIALELRQQNSGEHSLPALRHDIGNPFDGPLVPDDFSRAKVQIHQEDPSLALDVNILDEIDDPGVEPTTPRTRSSASRLGAIGAILFVIAALIAVAALAVLGDETTTPGGTTEPNTALTPTQPPDDPMPAPPPVEAPPPVIEPPPPAPPVKVAEKQKAPPPAKDPKKDPTKDPKKDPNKDPELDDLDAKADEALAKLLGEAAPEPKHNDRALSVACDEGDGQSCIELGDRLAKRKVGDKATKAFERACSFNVADGCHRAAVMEAANEEKSAELEARACKLGRKASCVEEVAETSTSS